MFANELSISNIYAVYLGGHSSGVLLYNRVVIHQGFYCITDGDHSLILLYNRQWSFIGVLLYYRRWSFIGVLLYRRWWSFIRGSAV